MSDPMKLKKTESATVRHTGSKAEREYSPASYEVYVHGRLVGQLQGYSHGMIQGNPYGHRFKPVIQGVTESVPTVGPQGIWRDHLREVAMTVYEQLPPED